MPVDVVLDAWMARYGRTAQPLPRQAFEDGSVDPLIADMAVIVYRMCHLSHRTDQFEYFTRTHRVYAAPSFVTDGVVVCVELVAPHERN